MKKRLTIDGIHKITDPKIQVPNLSIDSVIVWDDEYVFVVKWKHNSYKIRLSRIDWNALRLDGKILGYKIVMSITISGVTVSNSTGALLDTPNSLINDIELFMIAFEGKIAKKKV